MVVNHHSNLACMFRFYAIHFAMNTISRIRHAPPSTRKAIPKKRSLFPTKLDLLRENHFSPHVASTSTYFIHTVQEGDCVSASWQLVAHHSIEFIESAASCWSEPH